MKPRRTHGSTGVLALPGGTENNDLWYEAAVDDGEHPVIQTVWEPTAEERAAIAAGENVYLLVWGSSHPPVAMGVTDEPLGRRE